MDLIDTLFRLEKRSWKASHEADADFYQQHFADQVLGVFSWDDGPTGVFGKDLLLQGVKAFQPFVFYRLEKPQVVELTDNSAVLTYRATAQIEGKEEPYSVLIGSVYVNEAGTWRLAFHQQTPTEVQQPVLERQSAP